VASYPTNQIDYYGVGGTFTASDGTVYSYSYRVEVRATYYNIHGNTYTGMPTGHNIVAVDPNVFPLGTEMYVLSDEFDMGYRIAADIGGAVKGNLIDLWMDETNPDYIRFAHQGVVNMTAYVLG
jgi:3D (Asp-Asp-Asp) domain-containing protein